MIVCVCGLIGAGKTTFAENQDGIVSDFDQIGDKKKQIIFTEKNAIKGEKVYHVTCYPTPEEREKLEMFDTQYVWINTDQLQAMRNVEKRNRPRDMTDLFAVKEKNAEILSKYLNSDIKFRIVDIFQTNERW